MLHYFQPVIHYIHQNPSVGAVATFLIAFLESLPLIGTIIPGSVTMTAIGTLVGTGVLSGFSTVAWASLGALVGDFIGFISGYLFTDRIQQFWLFKKRPHWLLLSKQFFKKHGKKSIIVGRFIGPARSTVPLVAGLLKMQWSRFTLAAIVSAILWSIVYMVPGILIGILAAELPPHLATEFLLFGIVIVIILWLVFWITQYFFSQFGTFVNKKMKRLWRFLIKYKASQPVVRLIAVKQDLSDHYQLLLVLLFLLSLFCFFVVFYSVVENIGLTKVNLPVFHLLQSIRTHGLDRFFIAVTLLGNTLTMSVIGILVSLGLFIVRRWRAATHLLLLTTLTFSIIGFLKWSYYSPRPQGFQFVLLHSSFPSGHVGMSFVVLTMLAYLSRCLLSASQKWLPYTFCSVLLALIAVSRLYLGAHWVTDVLGSLTLGLTLLLGVIISYRRYYDKRLSTINRFYWFIVIILSIFCPWLVIIDKKYHLTLYQYERVYPVVAMSVNQWWHHPIRYLPLYRLNRLGDPIQPFNLQWKGRLTVIRSTLEQHGWKVVGASQGPHHSLKSFVSRKQYHLPILPWLYCQKAPSLILVKPGVHQQDRTILLRLWTSNAFFKDSRSSLWIGTVNYQIPPHKVGFLHTKKVSLQNSGGIMQLFLDLRKSHRYQYKLFQVLTEQPPLKVRLLKWDGRVIVIREAHPIK